MRNICPRLALLILILPFAVFAQNPAKWTLESADRGRSVKAGETLDVTLKAEIEPEWHLYALDQPSGGPVATTIKVTEGRQRHQQQ